MMPEAENNMGTVWSCFKVGNQAKPICVYNSITFMSCRMCCSNQRKPSLMRSRRTFQDKWPRNSSRHNIVIPLHQNLLRSTHQTRRQPMYDKQHFLSKGDTRHWVDLFTKNAQFLTKSPVDLFLQYIYRVHISSTIYTLWRL